MSVKKILDRLASTTKRKEKEQYLEEVKNTPDEPQFLKVCSLALDPRYTFNIVEFNSKDVTHEGRLTLKEAIEFIENELATGKVRGNTAIEKVEEYYKYLNEDDAYVFKNIIDRTLRCGVSSKTINKVWPECIYEHPYMRCSPYNEKNLENIKLPCLSQLKEDGMYVDIIVLRDRVEYRSRQGEYLPFNNKEVDNKLLDAVKNFGQFVLMGEALVFNEDKTSIMPREEGNGYLNSDDLDPSFISFRLWDLVNYEDWKNHITEQPYQLRYDYLEMVIGQVDCIQLDIVDTRTCSTQDEIINHFKENVQKGLEGSIVKNLDSIWKNGTSKDNVKLKIIFEIELIVTDVYEGEKGHKYENHLGGLVCESKEGKLIAHVGTGITDEHRKQWWDNPDKIIGSTVTVKSNDVKLTENNEHHTLTNPRLTKIRVDKSVSDSLERIFEQKESSVNSVKIIE